MKLSEQQVHSRPCSQMTGTRGFVSSAWAIFDDISGLRPSDAAVSEQNLRTLRRLTPWRRRTSDSVSIMGHPWRCQRGIEPAHRM